MIRLPRWMRVAMLATAVMNILGAITFIPSAGALREMGGLPAAGHSLYLAMVGAFVFIFGIAYLWAAITGAADRLFVAVAAAGKLAFFGLLVGYWVEGTLPATAVMSGAGDLVFGSLFLVWLYRVGSQAKLNL
jgi:hypothetical protein